MKQSIMLALVMLFISNTTMAKTVCSWKLEVLRPSKEIKAYSAETQTKHAIGIPGWTCLATNDAAYELIKGLRCDKGELMIMNTLSCGKYQMTGSETLSIVQKDKAALITLKCDCAQ
jgi:hypothetical protein